MPTDVMPLQGRSRLGPYRLLARVGEGGFGVVYLGLDDWGRAVAVRALRPLVGLNYDFEVLRRVSGPHVAELYAANADAGTSYVATRYVPGRSLEAVLAEDGPLGGRALIRLALGLADGLCSLHEVRVVHGQLEPGAVLVDDDHPVIIDIGVVQTGEGFLSTFGRGTAGFTAPEVDREAPSAAADVYAWAALVTYAATSRPPYSGRADAVGLPEPLASLVAAALAPDPAQRPTARELRDRLGETLGETFGAPREQQPEPDVPVVPEQRRGETTTAVVERPRGWRRGHRLIGVELVVLAGIVAAIAPTVSAIGIVSLILILRFADHIARSAARRREARGRSAWNAVRAVLALPWHATRTVAETLLCIPVAALVAASGTVPVVLVTDELRPTAAMTAGTAAAALLFVAASWLGLGGRPLRRVTGKILSAVVPSRVSAILASVALAGGVAGLCTVLLSEPPDWWPLDSTPSLDALDRWWRR